MACINLVASNIRAEIREIRAAKKQKQLTLGAFNFKKAITHGNREVSVEITISVRIEKKNMSNTPTVTSLS